MMIRRTLLTVFGTACIAGGASAQSSPVLDRMWVEGMERSQTWPLAQALMDSIGPRLTGTPGHAAAGRWLMAKYSDWGISAVREEYGTWTGWERGITHVDLVSPRVRTLEATLLAWSAGTNGPVEGDVVVLPVVSSPDAFEDWLAAAAGKFVLVNYAQPTCRADEAWEEWATPESFERMQAAREAGEREFFSRMRNYGVRSFGQLAEKLENANAAGWISSNWSGGWGVNKIFGAPSRNMPAVDVSCEDYGLLFRLAEAGQSPRLRLNATSRRMEDQPAFNIVGRLEGTDLPDEYVVLSAHLDSWDGASGATDNGTGTIMMMEAMRILKATYPNPRRTILVGHWGGEEQGLIGSGAFAEDHPEVVDGLQAALNQDNGTWRVDYIRMQGFDEAGPFFRRWLSRIPDAITRHIELDDPSVPERGGSDHMSFICRSAPGFRLRSDDADYRQYTWHTNRDTFDKIVFDDLKSNATLAAMLAYLASEEPERVPANTRALPRDERTGQPTRWPACRTVPRRAAN